MNRSIALFAAIYTALSTDIPLVAALGGAGRVYDTPPDGAPCPYVVIGDETAKDYGSEGHDGTEHTITIHAWTEAASSLSCKTISWQVRDALHQRALALSEGDLCNLRCEFQEFIRDPDGISWHGVLRFRAVTTADA